VYIVSQGSSTPSYVNNFVSSQRIYTIPLHYLVKHEGCKLACFVCAEPVLLQCIMHYASETLRMADSNCVKIVKVMFVDLNSRIDECHTGVVQFQRSVCHQ